MGHNDDGAAAPGLAAPEAVASLDHPGLAPLGAAAAAPSGLSPPLNDEARTVQTAGFRAEQGTGDEANCEGGSPAMQAAERSHIDAADKEFASLRDHLALAGFEVQVVGDGTGGTAYMVRRWSMSHTLPSLGAVRAFAVAVGVGP